MWYLQRYQLKLVDQKEAHMTSSRVTISNVCTDRAVGSAAGKKRAILDSLSAMPWRNFDMRNVGSERISALCSPSSTDHIHPPSLPNAVFPFLFREIRSGYGFTSSPFWSAGIGTRRKEGMGKRTNKGFWRDIASSFDLSSKPDLAELTRHGDSISDRRSRSRSCPKWTTFLNKNSVLMRGRMSENGTLSITDNPNHFCSRPFPAVPGTDCLNAALSVQGLWVRQGQRCLRVAASPHWPKRPIHAT